MDGLAYSLATDGATADVAALPLQCTLKAAIGCVGVGLHSGQRVSLTFHPAGVDHGVVFRRTDLGVEVPAHFDRVVDTRFCTVLQQDAARVGTVEHVMAALLGCGIDNVRIDIDGPEPPILDGAAAQFVFLLDCAGKVVQDAPRRVVEVIRPVRVSDGDAFAELRPGAGGFEMALSIDFAAAAIGRQALSLRFTPQSFRYELARARTFALAGDVDRLRATGMARGGSLDNAVVVDGARVLNPAGLRVPDEFVRHKLLDVVGDLALAGASIDGQFFAHRSGHTLNNRLLRALFADRTAWREVEPMQMSVAAE